MMRDAASLILYREDDSGLRVLMGSRHADHKFMPNHMVFPGGGVDPDDHGAVVHAPLPDAAMQRLTAAAAPELAWALAHAAARELAEETGLSLGDPPDLSGLDYLCRAETPDFMPIRFNARFFVAPAAEASGTLGGSGELELLDFYLADDLLELKLAPVTREMLLRLQDWRRATPAERRNAEPMVFRYPAWVADRGS